MNAARMLLAGRVIRMSGELLDPFLGKVIAGRYEVLEKLAQGGMGTVYVANDRRLERLVVLKAPTTHFLDDDSRLKRFQREIEGIRTIEHPGVVPIFDAGEVGGVPWFIQRYMQGGNLGDRIPIEADPASLAWVGQVAGALDFCHALGMVHRDVKPSNILFDENGLAYICDFGIARWMDQTDRTRLTQTGLMPGSPAYMSPEQALGSRVDGTSDQYALGACVYEALSGKLPFEGDSSVKIAIAKTKNEFPSLRMANPAIHRTASTVVDRVLAANPANRFESCEAFADALLQGVQGKATTMPDLVPTRASGTTRTTTTGGGAPRRARTLPLVLGALLLAVVVTSAWLAGWLPGGDAPTEGPPLAAAPPDANSDAMATAPDTALPALKIESPQNGALVREFPLRITGVVEHGVPGLEIHAGAGAVAQPDESGRFTLQLDDLEPGRRKIRVTYTCELEGHGTVSAHDPAIGRHVDLEIAVGHTKRTRELFRALELAERATKTESVVLGGRLGSPVPEIASITVNGVDASWTDDTITVELPLAKAAYGAVGLEILVTDLTGQSLTFEQELYLQPAVRLVHRVGDEETTRKSKGEIGFRLEFRHLPPFRTKILGSVEAPDGAEPLAILDPLGPGRGHEDVLLKKVREGRHRLRVEVRDLNGLPVTDLEPESRVEALVDRTKPTITVEAMTPLPERNRYRLVFKVTDNLATTLEVTSRAVLTRKVAPGASVTMERHLGDLYTIQVTDEVGNAEILEPMEVWKARGGRPEDLQPAPTAPPPSAGPGTMPALVGQPNFVAYLDGKSALLLEDVDVGPEYTLEATFQAERVSGKAALFASEGPMVWIERSSRGALVLKASVIDATGERHVLGSGGSVKRGRTMHVAFSRRGRTCMLHKDGKMIAKRDLTSEPAGWRSVFIGATRDVTGALTHPLQGRVKSLRLSKIARYPEDEHEFGDPLLWDKFTQCRFDFDQFRMHQILGQGQGKLTARGTPWLERRAPAEQVGLLFHRKAELELEYPDKPTSSRSIRWRAHLRLGPLPVAGRHTLLVFPEGALVWEAPLLHVLVARKDAWIEVGAARLAKRTSLWRDYTITAKYYERRGTPHGKAWVYVDEADPIDLEGEATVVPSPWREEGPPQSSLFLAPLPATNGDASNRPFAIGACRIERNREDSGKPDPESRFTWPGTTALLWDVREGLAPQVDDSTRGKSEGTYALSWPAFVLPLTSLGAGTTPSRTSQPPTTTRESPTQTSPTATRAKSENHVLELDGRSAYRFRLPGDWRLPSAFTIECWARGGHPDGEQALVSQCQLSGAGLWWFTNTDHPGRAPARAPGGIVFDARRKGGADYARANSGALEVGVWYHLAMTYENGRVRFFVNGTLESEATVNQPRMNQRYVFIGADPSARDTPEFNFTGLIDDVRISRGARYAKSFKPATHLAFDETTISLVDFQRAAVGPGGGDTTHAIVQGKTWARATPYGSPRIVPHDR